MPIATAAHDVQDVDTLIVGAGLAGATAALTLAADRSVEIIDAEGPAAGASGAAAGLVNPLMGRRARRAWRAEAALDAFREVLSAASAEALWMPGLLRPALRAKQAERFRLAAERHPHLATWHDAPALVERYPRVHAPHGGLHLQTAGAIDVSAFVRALLDASRALQTWGWTLEDWTDEGQWVRVRLQRGAETAERRARRLILALGYGMQRFPVLRRLGLHPVKGQTVTVHRPPDWPELPHLSGAGYVVMGPGGLVIGSSYEHTFSDTAPSAEQSQRILAKAAQMLPALTDLAPVHADAGVRMNVRSTRLPYLGPLPDAPRVWVVGGLGSKGLLMAPLLAQLLPAALRAPSVIPDELRLPTPGA